MNQALLNIELLEKFRLDTKEKDDKIVELKKGYEELLHYMQFARWVVDKQKQT